MNRSLKINVISMVVSLVLIIMAWVLSRNENTSLTIFLWALAFIIGGRAKAVQGIKDTIENRSLNVEILMLLSALGAFSIQNYQEGAILILIFGISGVLEEYSLAKSEKEFSALLHLAPQTAILLKDKTETEMDASLLEVGDIVVVKVGAVVPADGIIIKGTSSFNQAALTGEFDLVTKTVNDEVLSGSINEEAAVYVQVEKNPADSMVQKIVDFVLTAQAEKTPTQTWIDKFEKKYVYIVLLMSILLMIIPPLFDIWDYKTSIYRGIVLLVVASPCALVASITPTMLATMSNAAKHGILIKGATHIETLSSVDSIIMDKTGTITEGKPRVVDFVICLENDIDKQEVLEVLYTAEKQSNHPLALAIVKHLEGNVTHKYSDYESIEVPGQGIRLIIDENIWEVGRFESQVNGDKLQKALFQMKEEGCTTVQIILNSQLVGVVSLMDTIREGVDRTIQFLHDSKIEVIMLTGDHQQTANAIAKQIEIDTAFGNLYPKDKVNVVKDLKGQGKVVAMIGDGINDSPALAAADVGIAMGTATDVTLETSDVVFMNDKISNLKHLIQISSQGQKIAIQNVVFSIMVIFFLILANVFELIQLPLAVVFHEGSTILVILNGLRILKYHDVP